MSSEIERKFKLKKIPKNIIENIIPLEIVQTYLHAPNEQERRVRSINNEIFVITVKSPLPGNELIREENERQITEDDYKLFLTQQKGDTIKKKRYKIPVENGLTYEVDLYEDNLAGLMVVEVEFPTEEMANSFVPPEWFGEEVTSDKRYKNNSLAMKGMPSDGAPKRGSDIER